MRMVFLAAGQGTRLRPHTNDRPKCMVPLFGRPLLEYGLEAARCLGIERPTVVTGYLSEVIASRYGAEIDCVFNPRFASTNMVVTAFHALDRFADGPDEDVIVSYTDIVYRPSILEQIASAGGDICVVVDRDWESLWSLRMENPLEDAESLKIGPDGNIVEIGRNAESTADIEGQYIGLIKISKEFLQRFRSFYANLDPKKSHLGKSVGDLDMTSLLQLLCEAGQRLTPVWIDGGWLEIDSVEDLTAYEAEPRYRRMFSTES